MTNNKDYNTKMLFNASCLALIVTAMTFAIRARLGTVFGADGYGLTAEEIGFAFGPAFWGFTLAMIFGGPLVDVLGAKKILWIAFFGHLVGIIITLFARDFITLFIGTLAVGIGNGMVEAACNPLVATLYPNEKTKMLNRFHVWFPGGIVIGAVVAYIVMDKMGLSWQVMVSTLFIPLIAYGVMMIGLKFPQTERVTSGVSTSDMYAAVFTPIFIFMVVCMFMTAATELGTGQTIEGLLGSTGVSAILVLAFINGIMAFGRAFAGPIVHRLSTAGVLLFSAIFTTIGLFWLSYASGTMTFVAAFVFAVGICYFWPTMLGFVAEKVPESGALGLSIMGGAGMFSTSVALPIIGGLYEGLSGGVTLRYIAIMPLILIVAFSFLYVRYGKKKEMQTA